MAASDRSASLQDLPLIAIAGLFGASGASNRFYEDRRIKKRKASRLEAFHFCSFFSLLLAERYFFFLAFFFFAVFFFAVFFLAFLLLAITVLLQ
jgi:hypothetical protein